MRLRRPQMLATNDRCIVLPTTPPLGEEDMSRDKTARELAKDDKLIELLTLAEDQGWKVTPTNNGKLMWYPKDKEQSPIPSPMRLMGRSLANVRTALERAGLDTSSLRPAKPRQAILATTPDDTRPGASVDELTDAEKAHKAVQDMTKEVARDLLNEAVPELSKREADVEKINSAIDLYLVASVRAMLGFMEDVRPTLLCDHEVESGLKEKLEEAERLYLETCQELESVRKHADKLEKQLSDLGTQYSGSLKAQNDALERANKAENRLKALRSALTED